MPADAGSKSRFAEIIVPTAACVLMDAKAVSGSAAGHFDDKTTTLPISFAEPEPAEARAEKIARFCNWVLQHLRSREQGCGQPL
jgi:hypothetical protein